jgi:pimeloyl-ACP methyl ester carboxylesterase
MALAADAWRARGQTHRHRGHAIFFVDEEGEGEGTLVCVHGFPTSSFDWHRLWPRLRRRFARLLACDLIGLGWSDKPRGYGYSVLDQADLIEGLLRARGVARYHLLAHDYGDTVAQELLARQLVREPATAAVFGPRTQPSAAELDALWAISSHQDGPAVFPALLGYMAERRLHRARWVGTLVATQVPVRVIDGAADPVSGAHMVARYRALVPAPDCVELPGIGHYPQLEDPDAVLAALESFWSARGGAR